jgi:hypothetical protein
MAVALDERDVLDLVIAFLDKRGFHGGHHDHDFYPSSKLNRYISSTICLFWFVESPFFVHLAALRSHPVSIDCA